MTLYRNPCKTCESSAFDSPNAEIRFQKSVNLRFSQTFSASFSQKPRNPAPFAEESLQKPEFLEKSSQKTSKKPLRTEKTDPILQENAEKVSKTPTKVSNFNAETLNFEEKPRKVLKTGTFNQNYRGISGENTWKPLRKFKKFGISLIFSQ